MSYRRIEVNGQVFEYSVGKTHTKIRHIGAYPNDEVGIHVKKYWAGELINTVQVRPSDIAKFINGKKLKVENKRR